VIVVLSVDTGAAVCCCGSGLFGSGVTELYVDLRLTFAATAAFMTRGKSGTMPQVRHGGSGKASVAIVASKFDGTGFENEHIAQTQLPRSTCGVAIRVEASGNGLELRDPGEEEDATRCTAGEPATCCRRVPFPRFNGFGCKVTFADERRNPA
jgi:hypothetical protein